MPRVYTCPADPEKGERDGAGCRVYTAYGDKIPMVQRVELEADSDSGMATVHAVYCLDGKPVADPDKALPCVVTFRTWVQVIHKGQPDPERDLQISLWRMADGSIALDADPVPQVPYST